MYLGQLLDDGVAAATCTRQGLAVIDYQSAMGDEEAEDRVCGACCALAEQLLATADDVAEVEDECDQLLRRAAESDPRSAEPLQVLASLRSQQGRAEEALEALRRSVATWRSRRGGRDVDPDADLDDDADEGRADEHLGEYEVSYEFRFETAKLLLELDESVDEAVGVLEELLNERDDVVDVWQLLALANHGGCNFDRALELVTHAEQLNERQGGDEATHANLMELRLAIEESKEKWNEEVGEEHRGGGDDMSD
jgi:tetratricopeptide (TPR) repeat protein